jgi:hypothetical protein
MRFAVSGVLLSVKRLSRGLGRSKMSHVLIFLGVVVVWLLLQAYILPKLGIST